MARPGFMIYFDTIRPALRLLTDEQKGAFFQAMVDYAQFGHEPDFEGAMAGAWAFLRDSLDKDNTRYAEIVEKRAQAGKLGGLANASKRKQMLANEASASKTSKTKQTKPTSTSISTSNKDIPPIAPQGGEADGFDRFWQAYPRKVAKAAARKAWGKLHPDQEQADVILTAVERDKGTDQWQRDGGQYIPYPATWLNQQRWEDEPEAILEKEVYIPVPQEDKPDEPRHWEPGMDIRAFID